MKTVIGVIGSDVADETMSSNALKIAEHVGALIAQHNAVLLCGGRGGIMEAACKGAQNQKGITIGILPESKTEANPYVDIALPSGMGNRRNFLVVNMSDAIIAIGGRWGTLNEITFSAIIGKPLVLLKTTGGCVDMLCKSTFLQTHPNAHIATSAEEAVEIAFSLIKNIG